MGRESCHWLEDKPVGAILDSPSSTSPLPHTLLSRQTPQQTFTAFGTTARAVFRRHLHASASACSPFTALHASGGDGWSLSLGGWPLCSAMALEKFSKLSNLPCNVLHLLYSFIHKPIRPVLSHAHTNHRQAGAQQRPNRQATSQTHQHRHATQQVPTSTLDSSKSSTSTPHIYCSLIDPDPPVPCTGCHRGQILRTALPTQDFEQRHARRPHVLHVISLSANAHPLRRSTGWACAREAYTCGGIHPQQRRKHAHMRLIAGSNLRHDAVLDDCEHLYKLRLLVGLLLREWLRMR